MGLLFLIIGSWALAGLVVADILDDDDDNQQAQADRMPQPEMPQPDSTNESSQKEAEVKEGPVQGTIYNPISIELEPEGTGEGATFDLADVDLEPYADALDPERSDRVRFKDTDDAIHIGNVTGTAQDDTITGTLSDDAALYSIDLGDGDDQLNIESSFFLPGWDDQEPEVHGGAGDDTIRIVAQDMHPDPEDDPIADAYVNAKELEPREIYDPEKLLIHGDEGDDVIHYVDRGPVLIDGGEGNDTLVIEDATYHYSALYGANRISGGPGDDLFDITAKPRADYYYEGVALEGGEGNDTFSFDFSEPSQYVYADLDGQARIRTLLSISDFATGEDTLVIEPLSDDLDIQLDAVRIVQSEYGGEDSFSVYCDYSLKEGIEPYEADYSRDSSMKIYLGNSRITPDDIVILADGGQSLLVT